MKAISNILILAVGALFPLSAPAEHFTEGKKVPATTEKLKPGDFVWEPERSAAGPVPIMVSKPEQVAYVYRNGIRIARSSVSTGRPGHPAPVGVFDILEKETDHVSSIYKGAEMPWMERLTFTLATAPVSGAAGLALIATGISTTFESAIRDQSPGDLRLASLKRLLAMGCERADAEAFLNNIAFSPSLQSALVLHLDSMSGVANRSAFIQLAGESCADEGDALFFAQTARILAELHANGRTIAQIKTLGSLPIAVSADGGVIVALEWDHAAWTQNAAAFIAQLKAVKIGDKAPTSYIVALSGDASPTVQQQLQTLGITLATRLAPGPLK